jgi:hypothetical protein
MVSTTKRPIYPASRVTASWTTDRGSLTSNSLFCAPTRCRTAALGGRAISIFARSAVIRPSPIIPAGTGTAPSVRPRLASAKRGEGEDLLAVAYFHVVFTLPHELNARTDCGTSSVGQAAVAGILTMHSVPSPGLLSTVIVASCRSAIHLAIDNPRPAPPAPRERTLSALQNRSKM